jgi:mRNA-degrading endonuclease RelE of RelBE toxin-antitoxin system
MRFLQSKPFRREYRKLPPHIQKKVDKSLALMAHDPYHPGLNARKLTNQGDIYETRVDLHYRMTYQTQDDLIILRRVGTHEIYKKP